MPTLIFVTPSHNLSPLPAEVRQILNIPELVTKRHERQVAMLFFEEQTSIG